ncbi:MAG TPA: HEAT repeat domain-containing protein [Gemmataceae bacterium]|nr:HEAT repeat domain-containing protein [Gemmataceae bacterium]
MRLFVGFCVMAAATVLLCTAGQPEPAPGNPGGDQPGLPELRKLLAHPEPLIRLKASLLLLQRDEEKAVEVLIDLLAELRGDERRQAEHALQQLAGEWSPSPSLLGDDEVSRQIRRECWAGWWRTMDGPALLTAIRQQTLNKDDKDKLPVVAPRLLAIRKPGGAAAALLAYLPLTNDRTMQEAIGKALKSLVVLEGKADPALVKALSDPLPGQRLAAAEALAGGGADHWPAVRKLLTDPQTEVRLRVALALVYAQDKATVPALIDLLGELPRTQAWEAVQVLQVLAGAKAPALPAGKDDVAARKKLRDSWQAWWKQHGAAVDMAQLAKIKGVTGLTLVAEIGPNNKAAKKAAKKAAVPANPITGGDRLVAIDSNGQPRWQIENLNHPIDFQMLPGDHVLIAEYGGNRVTERDLKGKIVWEVSLPRPPISVQRLANGNTFIALYYTPTNGGTMVEVDQAGKTVATYHNPADPGNAGAAVLVSLPLIRAAYKLANGEMLCLLSNDTCVRLDATGKEIKRFSLPLFGGTSAVVAQVPNFAGNIDVTPKGHVVVVLNDNTVAEYDPNGKIVWQAKASGNRATRLPNGNTLVASQAGGLVELDHAGQTVWQYQPPAGYQAVRARRP